MSEEKDSSGKETPRSPYNSRRMTEASSELDEQSRMQLAHELYMNEDMQMTMPNPGSIYGQVKEIVHRAFWDSVRAGLESNPPQYEHCLRLIAEIKDILLELVPTKAERVRAQINEVMDIELYQQQIEQSTFDLYSVARFVVETLLGLCAPARDATVRAILTKTDPVELLKEVFAALDLIRLDFVNYQLKALRPTLLANSVQYEQSKFRGLLEGNPAALDRTRQWLATTERQMRQTGAGVSPSTLLSTAFLRLLQEEVTPIPETIAMDHSRFTTVAKELEAVVFSAACIVVLQTGVGPVVQHDSFANKVRVAVYQLCSEEYISHPRELLPHITEKALSIVRETVRSRDLRPEECENVRAMMGALVSADNPVYCLLRERARQYLASLCSGAVSEGPSGFGVCRSDLQGVASKYTHLVSYNRGVYGPFYADIITEIISSANNPETSDSNPSSSSANNPDTQMN